MSELIRIGRALGAVLRAGEPCWLASLIGIEGSAYRRPGARLLFGRDGALAGAISGGCVDRDVVRTGAWACRRGAIVRRFDERADELEAGSRTGCGGKLQVLIEPVSPALAEHLTTAAEELELERRTALGTVVASRGAEPALGSRALCTKSTRLVGAFASSPALEAALAAALDSEPARVERMVRPTFEALLEIMDPAPHCFVFGTGEDVVPIAQLAGLLDWGVTVCAPGRRFSVADRFAGLAELKVDTLEACVEQLAQKARPLAIVMSHDYEQDRRTLSALLGSKALYVGMLGPARRTERMLSELGSLPEAARARLGRVHGPAGLHLGGDGAAAIALSIVAEAQAVLCGAEAGFLRDRALGIHECAAPPKLQRRGA